MRDQMTQAVEFLSHWQTAQVQVLGLIASAEVCIIYSIWTTGRETRYNIIATASNWSLHGLVIEKYSWSAENAIFYYLKIAKPCRWKIEETYPIW